MAKRPKSRHQPFESATEQGKFTKVCDDMMQSPSWADLSLRQRGLYLELKRKYTQKKSAGVLISDNADDISIPKSEAQTMYGAMRSFRVDIDALISHGFIRLVQSGFNTRTVNIYGFSDRWKRYGKPDFEIPIKEQRRTSRAFTVQTTANASREVIG